VIKVAQGDPEFLARIIEFRQASFRRSRRDPGHAEAWSTDRYDATATHFALLDGSGGIQAAVRMTLDGRWPIEDRLGLDIDTSRGVELGRLAVGPRYLRDRRTLYELMAEACRYCIGSGRPHVYGLMIAPFRRSLEREGIPLEVRSPSVVAYGMESAVVHLDARRLLEVYGARSAAA